MRVFKLIPIFFLDQWESPGTLEKIVEDNLRLYEFDCGGIVPQILVETYAKLSDSDITDDITQHCAFHFPAVVLALGRDHWHHLSEAYQTLASNRPWKVRRTIAYSIHEIAIILGEELTKTDLLPIYEGFIKDLDEVRIGVLMHMSTFIGMLKPEDRKPLLMQLHSFLTIDNAWNWRFRRTLAEQLRASIQYFEVLDVSHHIAPIATALLYDKVAAVRSSAIVLVSDCTQEMQS